MSELLLKAKQNYNVANELLQKTKHFAPVVHCSYYMCIQLMIHCIIKEGLTEDQIKDEIRKKRGASHDYYITETFRILTKKRDNAIGFKFNNHIKELKAFREESDYKNIPIDEKKANQSFQTSLVIKDIFRSVMNVSI